MKVEISEYEKIHGKVEITLDNSEILRYNITGRQHILVIGKLLDKKDFWKIKGYCEKYGERAYDPNEADVCLVIDELLKML